MKKLLHIFILLLYTAGKAGAQDYFCVMTYNVENLFDTIHDAGKRDTEFLPDGERKWNRWRMWKKLKDISKVIAAADTVNPCGLVGLCEVENDTVMTYLTQRTPMRTLGYRYVMTDSRDERGIDVALLYYPRRFRLLHHQSIRARTETATRDVLYVCGTMPGGDTLDVYMVHLPSKLGKAAAERNRRQITQDLLAHADSVGNARTDMTILIMGDFNDELKGGQMKPYSEKGFTDLTKGLAPGTYKFQGEWGFLDHILIKTTRQKKTDCEVVGRSFMLEREKNGGGKRPRRTYLGPHYHGGISDHLPVMVRIEQ